MGDETQVVGVSVSGILIVRDFGDAHPQPVGFLQAGKASADNYPGLLAGDGTRGAPGPIAGRIVVGADRSVVEDRNILLGFSGGDRAVEPLHAGSLQEGDERHHENHPQLANP